MWKNPCMLKKRKIKKNHMMCVYMEHFFMIFNTRSIFLKSFLDVEAVWIDQNFLTNRDFSFLNKSGGNEKLWKKALEMQMKIVCIKWKVKYMKKNCNKRTFTSNVWFLSEIKVSNFEVFCVQKFIKTHFEYETFEVSGRLLEGCTKGIMIHTDCSFIFSFMVDLVLWT